VHLLFSQARLKPRKVHGHRLLWSFCSLCLVAYGIPSVTERGSVWPTDQLMCLLAACVYTSFVGLAIIVYIHRV
jgi:EamA domain-containing membrane protein RarD